MLTIWIQIIKKLKQNNIVDVHAKDRFTVDDSHKMNSMLNVIIKRIDETHLYDIIND